MLKVEDLKWFNSHSWSLALHSSVSVIGKGGLFGPVGVSDLAGQPHGARLSVMRGAHVSASCDGYVMLLLLQT